MPSSRSGGRSTCAARSTCPPAKNWVPALSASATRPAFGVGGGLQVHLRRARAAARADQRVGPLNRSSPAPGVVLVMTHRDLVQLGSLVEGQRFDRRARRADRVTAARVVLGAEQVVDQRSWSSRLAALDAARAGGAPRTARGSCCRARCRAGCRDRCRSRARRPSRRRVPACRAAARQRGVQIARRRRARPARARAAAVRRPRPARAAARRPATARPAARDSACSRLTRIPLSISATTRRSACRYRSAGSAGRGCRATRGDVVGVAPGGSHRAGATRARRSRVRAARAGSPRVPDAQAVVQQLAQLGHARAALLVGRAVGEHQQQRGPSAR